MTPRIIKYPIPLHDGGLGCLELPENITMEDAERIGRMARAIVMDAPIQWLLPVMRSQLDDEFRAALAEGEATPPEAFRK